MLDQSHISRTSLVQVATDHVCAWLDEAEHNRQPFEYWLLRNILPRRMVDALLALPFAPPGRQKFAGQRDANNSTRVYFTPEKQSWFSVIRDTAAIFAHPETVGRLHALTGARLKHGRLRIEYCQDTDGFWLEPHTDISVKLFTMIVYLSPDPALFGAGTDIYDATPDHHHVATAPYEQNAGIIFIPGKTTWHGFSRRPISGVRKSLIINYVTPAFRAVEELA